MTSEACRRSVVWWLLTKALFYFENIPKVSVQFLAFCCPCLLNLFEMCKCTNTKSYWLEFAAQSRLHFFICILQTVPTFLERDVISNFYSQLCRPNWRTCMNLPSWISRATRLLERGYDMDLYKSASPFSELYQKQCKTSRSLLCKSRTTEASGEAP